MALGDIDKAPFSSVATCGDLVDHARGKVVREGTQPSLTLAQGHLCAMRLGDVGAFDEDCHHLTLGVGEGLVDEVDDTLLDGMTRPARQADRGRGSPERLTSRVDLV